MSKDYSHLPKVEFLGFEEKRGDGRRVPIRNIEVDGCRWDLDVPTKVTRHFYDTDAARAYEGREGFRVSWPKPTKPAQPKEPTPPATPVTPAALPAGEANAPKANKGGPAK